MPPVAAYVFEAVVTYLADAGVSVLATEIVAGIAYVATLAAVVYGAQMILSAFQKKPRLLSNQQLVKSAIAPRDLVYGRVQKSGTLLFLQQSGNKNQDLFMVVAFAANQCANIDQLNLNDFQITYDAATGNFNGEINLNNGVVSNNYRGLGSFFFSDSSGQPHFGRANQLVDTAFAAAGAQFGALSTLNGICYVGYHFIYNQNVYGGGVPNPTVIIRGKQCLDPRICAMPSGSIAIATNTLTLAAATGQIGNTVIGPGLPNGTVITGIAGNVLTLSAYAVTAVTNQQYIVGSPLYSNNSALVVMDYMMDKTYGFKCNPGDFDLSSLVASLNNCDEQVQLVDGTFESRYTTDTVIDTSQTPGSILNDLLTAMGGEIVYAGGQWFVYSGMWRPPTVTLSENAFSGTPMIPTMPSRRDLINSVKGLFVCPQQFWQPTDFPPIQIPAYIAQDQGEVLWLDLQLPATTSAARSQRLAKIAVLRARTGTTTLSLPCKLTALIVQCGDNIMLNYARMGWVLQLFECVGFVFSCNSDSSGKPILGINLTLRGTAPTIWNWQAGSEIPLPQGPSSNLPNPFSVVGPTNFSVLSNSGTIQIAPDGTVVPALQCSWTPPLDGQVQGGGIVQMQFRVTGTAAWIDLPDMEGTSSIYYITNVVSGVAYDVRIRSVTQIGVDSPWVEVDNTVCAQKTAAPTIPNGSGLSSTGIPPALSGPGFLFGTMAFWTASTDPDWAFSEIKAVFFNNPNDTTYSWGTPGVSVGIQPTRERFVYLYNATLQPGFTFVRHVDTSGNRSAWIFLGNANNFATAGIGTIATQNQSSLQVSGLQVGQLGAGSVPAIQAIIPISAVAVLNGGASSETFVLQLGGKGLTAKPTQIVGGASDGSSIAQGLLINYNFDDAGNTSQQVVLTVTTKGGGVIAAGPHRFSLNMTQ